MVLHFKNDAIIWWEAQKAQNKNATNYDEFISQIKNTFIPTNYYEKTREAWDKFRQLKGENISDYIKRFWKLLLTVQTIDIKHET